MTSGNSRVGKLSTVLKNEFSWRTRGVLGANHQVIPLKVRR